MDMPPSPDGDRADSTLPRTVPRCVVFVSSLRGYGGGERWMLDAAAGLQARGHDVRLVARPGSALAARSPGRRLACIPLEMRNDVDPPAVLQLARLFHRMRPDAVCANLDREIRLVSLALAASRRLGRTRLVPRRGSEFPLKDRWHYRVVYRRVVHRVIVNSKATQRTMCSAAPWFGPERTVLVYNGIDPAEFDVLEARRDALRRGLRERIGAPPDAPVVTLVGELSERKGQHRLVAAAPRILEAHPQVRFVLVGEGDRRSAIEAEVRERGLDGVVILTGFRDDVAEILVASDVLTLPSRVEGFGYVLVEAMAAALPVVAARASSIPEIVVDGETGLLHDLDEIDGLARAVNAILADPERARAMGRAGRRRVRERFTLERMLDDVERVLFG